MYRLSVNGRRPNGIKEMYEENEQVNVSFRLMSDSDIQASSNDVELGRPEITDEVISYSFIMPSHDVEIVTKRSGCMSMLDNSPVMDMKGYMAPSIGMLGTLKFSEGMSAAPELSEGNRYCPSCGARVSSEAKFCGTCGSVL